MSANITQTTEQQFLTQLQFLGRDATRPYTIIKADNTQIYAHDLRDNSLHKLITKGTRYEYLKRDKDGNVIKEKDDRRERWDNGCLKYYFGKRWNDGFAQISKLAKQGKEIFLIPNYIHLDPNSANGIGADFIDHATTVFVEADNTTLNQQWDIIHKLETELDLKAGLVLFSGGKSLHTYFQLTERLTDLEQWKRLQRKLIAITNSDPAIATYNREMRLAGVARKNKDSYQTIELKCDRAYYPEEIEGKLDSTNKFPYGLDDDRFRRWKREGDKILGLTPEQLNPPHRTRDDRNLRADRFGDAAPLEHFLTQHDQALIDGGAGSGRNNKGLKLAKNLIATVDRLSRLGIPYSGNAYDLFLDYCRTCPSGGGWNQREWEQIWRSAPRGNPTPSLPDEALEKRAFFYQVKNNNFTLQRREELENERLEQIYGKIVDPITGAKNRAIAKLTETINFFKQEVQDALNLDKQELQTIFVPTHETTPINYVSGTLKNFDANKEPLIYGAGQRKKVWSEANASHYQNIIDISSPGRGKSHDASHLSPNNFDFGWDEKGNEQGGQVIYFVNEPDKPPIDMEEQGWIRLPKLDEETNCHETPKRHALAQKGIKKSSEGQQNNPICGMCPFKQKCKGNVGKGKLKNEPYSAEPVHAYGFKSLMKEALASPKVYGHPLGFPRDNNDKAIAIFDESLIPPTTTQEITLDQIVAIESNFRNRQLWQEAEGIQDDLHYQLQPIFDYFKDYLSSGTKSKSTPSYGLKLADIKADLKPILDDINDFQVNYIRDLETQMARKSLELINKFSTPEDIARLVQTPLFGDILAILKGERGALEIGKQHLYITRPNSEGLDLIDSFKMSIFLDATAIDPSKPFEEEKARLCNAYGFDPDSTLIVQEQSIPTPHLEIKQMTHAGLNTSQRSAGGNKRKETIISELRKIHPDLGVIDYKDHSSDEELKHFKVGDEGARGSNKLQERSAIAIVGTPYTALNTALAEYQTLTGRTVFIDDEGFQAYYKRLLHIQFIQEIGRARANRRPHETISIYIITREDLSFLKTLGVKVTKAPVFHYVPELTPQHIKQRKRLVTFFAGLVESGRNISKVKQKEAAEFLKMQSTNLSRLLSSCGGWIRLREKIITLFKKAIEVDNFSPEEDVMVNLDQLVATELGQEYGLELDSPEKVCEAIEHHGWKPLYEYYQAAPLAIKSYVATAVAMAFGLTLPLEELQQFLIDQCGLSLSEVGINPEWSPPPI